MAQVDKRFLDLHDNPKCGGSQGAEWDDKTVHELEKLLTDHLHTHFKHAIKSIVGCGYKEQDAETIILRSRLFHGNRDIISSILTCALSSVNINKEPHVTGYHVFENLESLVKYTLLEMICALREVKPSLTVLEAMWLIFVCDFNISNACTKEVDCNGSCSQAMKEEKYTEATNAISTRRNSENVSYRIPKSALKHLVTDSQSVGLTEEPDPQLSKGDHGIGEEVQDLYQRFTQEKNPGCSGKSLSIDKNEMHWQKELLLGKSYKVRTSKGTFKAKFLPLKSVSGSSGVIKKSSSKLSTPNGSTSENNCHHKTDSTSTLSVADTPIIAKDANFHNSSSSAILSYYGGIPFDKTSKKYIPQDEKDEVILELAPRLQQLQKIVQGWTDWANEKFEQGITRIQKVKAEMITVQKEKEEAEKSHTNYHSKRHVGMEKAWVSAVALVESTNSTLRQLETQNSTLSFEMKSAECKAQESSRDLQKALQQEQIVLKNSQSIDQEKCLLLKELSSLKINAADLVHKVENAKVCLKQFEGLWKNENKEKLKSLSEAETFKGRRIQLEALEKAKENAIRERSRCEIQKTREKSKELQAEISVLKSETLQTRTVMDYSSSSMGFKNACQYPGVHAFSGVAQRLSVHNFRAIDKKREMECVVCLAEERSVLFLPCAHQVVCTQCNMQHEKEMDACPSCRTPIQRRIQVRSHTSY